ncbi:polysaccharide deacetylase family protein [Filifactor alocis]|uniref:polysaccharide deacetylase family protein n=1 Tax=Filifactor alocis TaxID=143361 RepID=UPI003F9ECF30
MKRKFLLLFTVFFLMIPQLSFANVNHTGIPILMYHHFTTGNDVNSPTVSQANFERQMNYLYEHGYTTIHLNQLEDFLDGKIQLPAKTVVITMDDGYRSNYEIAYPILKKYHMRATQFPIVENIGTLSEYTNSSRLPHCSADEMKAMKDVFEFQSHTYNTHYLTTDKKSALITKDYNDVYADLSKASTTLAMLDCSPYAFSYPYGSYNDNIKQVLKNIGVRMAVTVRPGRVTRQSNKLELPRYNISGTINFEDFKKIVSEDPDDVIQEFITKTGAPVDNSNIINITTEKNPETFNVK